MQRGRSSKSFETGDALSCSGTMAPGSGESEMPVQCEQAAAAAAVLYSGYPMAARRATTSQDALRFRRIVLNKKQDMCQHYISPGGCALQELCPHRHVGSQRTIVTTSHMGGIVSSCRSSTYAEPMTTGHRDASGIVWLWCSLPCSAGSARQVQWQTFGAEWSSMLECAFLAADSRGRGCSSTRKSAILKEEYVADFSKMTLCRRDDGGSRRAIQRIEVTGCPAWFLQVVDASGTTTHKIKEDRTEGGTDQLESVEAADADSSKRMEPLDGVAAAFLEYHYCHGGKNIFTIEANNRKVHVNLLTMVASEVGDVCGGNLSASRGAVRSPVGSRLRGAAAAAINSMRLGLHPVAVPAPSADEETSVPPPSLPSASSAALSPRAPPRQFRILRQDITIKAVCEPSNPYDHMALRQVVKLRCSTTHNRLHVFSDTAVDDRGCVPGTVDDALPADMDVQKWLTPVLPCDPCDHWATCKWESGRHLWRALHVCPFGKASQCYLCDAVALLAGKTKESLREAPELLRAAAERGAAHQRLFAHDATHERGTLPQRMPPPPVSHPQRHLDQTVVAWRRQQALSRLFRSEWDRSSPQANVSGTAATDVLLATQHVGETLHAVALRNVAAGSQEMHQVLQLLEQRAGEPVTFRRRATQSSLLAATDSSVASLASSQSDVHQSVIAPSPPPLASATSSVVAPSTACALHWSLYHTLHRQNPVGRGGSFAQREGHLHDELPMYCVQRVEHPFFFSRYLRCRNELFAQWQLHDAPAAAASFEETLFRLVPRSWLHRIMHPDDVAVSHELRFSLGHANGGHRRDNAAATSWWCFYRDLASALEETLVPNIAYVLLVAVGYAGSAVRMQRTAASSLVSPPLVYPWHLNGEDDDGVRVYRQHHSVVCETYTSSIVSPTPPSCSGEKLEKEAVGSGRPAPPSESEAATPLTSTANSSTSLSARAKLVFLYDACQWCPMYLVHL